MRVVLTLLLIGVCGCHKVFLQPDFIAETRVETKAFALRTDLSSDARNVLLAAAEEMRGELDTVYPSPEGEQADDGAPRREIVAFSDTGDFKKFLRAHLFSQERAIGFYC